MLLPLHQTRNGQIQHFADLQRQRIEQLRMEFCEEQSTLINEFETERSLICAQHSLEVCELQDIMYAMDQSFEDRDAEARGEFQNQKDELKNKVRVHVLLLCRPTGVKLVCMSVVSLTINNIWKKYMTKFHQSLCCLWPLLWNDVRFHIMARHMRY